jgi:protein TonB
LQSRSVKSFAIAIVVYLPILAAFFLSLKSIERDRRAEKLTPIAIVFFEEISSAANIETPPIAPAPASATAAQPSVAPQEPRREQALIGDQNAPKPIAEQNASAALSVTDLNAIFASQTPKPTNAETPPSAPPKTAIAAELIDLYGAIFYDLTPKEREFMEQNLNQIQTITQRYLWQRGYPRLAVDKGMFGEVILGFTLMPNGDITTIEVVKSSGWSLLDDHAIDTIKTAYKDYPHPNEPARVRMRVIYRL